MSRASSLCVLLQKERIAKTFIVSDTALHHWFSVDFFSLIIKFLFRNSSAVCNFLSDKSWSLFCSCWFFCFQLFFSSCSALVVFFCSCCFLLFASCSWLFSSSCFWTFFSSCIFVAAFSSSSILFQASSLFLLHAWSFSFVCCFCVFCFSYNALIFSSCSHFHSAFLTFCCKYCCSVCFICFHFCCFNTFFCSSSSVFNSLFCFYFSAHVNNNLLSWEVAFMIISCVCYFNRDSNLLESLQFCEFDLTEML